MYNPDRVLLCLFVYKLASITCELCNPIGQCSDKQRENLQLGRLNYDVIIRNNKNTLCPRSDLNIPHWLIRLKNQSDNSLIVAGDFCSFVFFNASVVCNDEGSLVFFDLSELHNQRGSLLFEVIGLNVSLMIMYAQTGVYPVTNSVSFKYSQDIIELRWFVYHSNPRPEIRTYHNEKLLTSDHNTTDDSVYIPFIDETTCAGSNSAESTALYSLFILNPTTSFSGEYVLVLNAFSATITLVIDPSNIPDLSSEVLSSTQLTVTTTTDTSTPSTTASTNSNVIVASATVGSIMGVLILLLGVGLVVYGVWKFKKRTQEGTSAQNPARCTSESHFMTAAEHLPVVTIATGDPNSSTVNCITSADQPHAPLPSSAETVVEQVDSNQTGNTTNNVSSVSSNLNSSTVIATTEQPNLNLSETNTNNLECSSLNQMSPSKLPGNARNPSSQLASSSDTELVDLMEKIVEGQQRHFELQREQLGVQQNIATYIELALVEQNPPTDINSQESGICTGGDGNCPNASQSGNMHSSSILKEEQQDLDLEGNTNELHGKHSPSTDISSETKAPISLERKPSPAQSPLVNGEQASSSCNMLQNTTEEKSPIETSSNGGIH